MNYYKMLLALCFVALLVIQQGSCAPEPQPAKHHVNSHVPTSGGGHHGGGHHGGGNHGGGGHHGGGHHGGGGHNGGGHKHH